MRIRWKCITWRRMDELSFRVGSGISKSLTSQRVRIGLQWAGEDQGLVVL